MRSVARVVAMTLVGLAACIDSTAPSKSGGLSLVMPTPASPGILDSGRVVLTGPTSKTVTVTPGATVTIDKLDPGTYTISLQGFFGGGIAYTAKVSGVNVVAGQNTTATVPALLAAFTVTVSPGTGSIAPGATQQFTAVAKDAQGTTLSGIIYFWASSNQNVALVDQNGLATGVGGGSATISGLGMGVPGSAALTVTGPVPTQLAFSSQPTSSTAGANVSPAVEVEVRDASGNRVTTARNAVTIAIGNNAGGGTLSGTAIVNAVNGIASFSGLSINKVGTGYTVTASSGTLTGATSAAFDIAAGPPAQLAFTVQPVNTKVGAAIAPAIQVAIQDRLGNPTGATDAVTVALGTNPSGGVLSGTTTQSAASGTATFGNLSVSETGAGYTLVTTSGTLTAVVSQQFNVTARALVVNRNANSLSVIETATNTVLTTVGLVGAPFRVAITPDGAGAYVTNGGANSVSLINTATNTVVGSPIAVGATPYAVAITPDGTRAYVTNFGAGTVSVINTATNTVVGGPITVGAGPAGLAITPDGALVYVANQNSANVSVIQTATNAVTTIAGGTSPFDVAISPNGAFAYVANFGSNNVSVFAIPSNAVVAIISVGNAPEGVAITPDGTFAYVSNRSSNTVSVISTVLNTVVGGVAVGGGPQNLAISPGGAFVYVTNSASNNVSVISTATNKVVRTISVGSGPWGIDVRAAP